jgi:hypothetical protein
MIIHFPDCGILIERQDAPVLGFSEKGTKFAIERAGNGEYVVSGC